MGIYFPTQDASWELPKSSDFYNYQDMYVQHKKCDIKICCRKQADILTLLYTGYKMLGFTRGGAIMAPPLETSKHEATEACEGSN